MSVSLSRLLAPSFHPVHRDIARHGHAEYWLRGGRGSAKSSFASVEVLLHLLRDPAANAVVCRKVAATMRGSVWEQLRWAARQLGLQAYFRFSLTPLMAEYIPTGQRVVFLGADDPNKSKSIRAPHGCFSMLWFEELTEFSGMGDVRTIKASVLRGSGHTITLCTYNPPASARNWVNAESLSPRPDRLIHSGTYLDLPREWLGDAFLNEAEFLRAENERVYRHMYLGEITGTGGQVFDNLRLGAVADDPGRAYNGLDFGFAVDPDMLVRAAYDPRTRKLWLLDEFRGTRLPAEKLAEAVRARCGTDTVRCDHAEPRMISRLRALGVNAMPVKKGPGSVDAGMRWLQTRAEIAIDPKRCPHAAKEFSAYEYATAPDGTFLSEYPDRDNHAIDALRYAMEPMIGERVAYTQPGSALQG